MNVLTCAMLEMNSSYHAPHRTSCRYNYFVKLWVPVVMIRTFKCNIWAERLFENNTAFMGSYSSILHWSSISGAIPCIINIPWIPEQSKYYPCCLSRPTSASDLFRYTYLSFSRNLHVNRHDYLSICLRILLLVYQVAVYHSILIVPKSFTSSKISRL